MQFAVAKGEVEAGEGSCQQKKDEDGKAEIYSSGKILSEGTFTIESDIIKYEEILKGGIRRKIPFLVKELKGNHLVFETMIAPIQRITAVKGK